MGYGLAYTGFTALPYLLLGGTALVVGAATLIASKVTQWRARR